MPTARATRQCPISSGWRPASACCRALPRTRPTAGTATTRAPPSICTLARGALPSDLGDTFRCRERQDSNASLSSLPASGLILLTEGLMAASALPSPKAHRRTFCDFAAEVGYPTRGFKEDAGICSSNMTDVATTPGKNRLRNNLAFYSMAEHDSVAKLHRVSLILNINNTAEKAPAYAELVRIASGVAAKIVGQPPAGFAQVIAFCRHQDVEGR